MYSLANSAVFFAILCLLEFDYLLRCVGGGTIAVLLHATLMTENLDSLETTCEEKSRLIESQESSAGLSTQATVKKLGKDNANEIVDEEDQTNI